jgi:Mg-chelatase subunit ChlD
VSPRRPNARKPQVLVFVVDDSNSMAEPANGSDGKSKAEVVSRSIEGLLRHVEMDNSQTTGYRFLVSVVSFGDEATVLCENVRPPDFRKLDLFGDKLKFRGKSGGTEMWQALNVTRTVLVRGIEEIQTIPGFDEASAPYPLVMFFSDGQNTGDDITGPIENLHKIQFSDGRVVVVACGIGQRADEFEAMKLIASSPELAINLEVESVGAFIAKAEKTILASQADLAQEMKANVRNQLEKR